MNSKLSSQTQNNSKGSIWHRWEPHIHIPGTILNDQFKNRNLEEYCTLIDSLNPPIRTLGITDYYSIKSYERILDMKKQGYLKNVELIFANIELRFKIATASDKAINGHLLFSPKDPNHISEIQRFLQKLTYSTGLEVYNCQEADLIKLGKDHDKSILADNKALEIGTIQFKVDFDQLINNIKNSAWAQDNLLIAVASGKDGSGGLQSDASFSSTRRHIERSSHIIFSGNQKDRSFWLGKGVLSKEKVIENYSTCKLCMHGSDAHTEEMVGNPNSDKYTWIKGDLAFESLLQACIEPEDRAFIGNAPPENKLAPYVIDNIDVTNATWMQPQQIPLNPGLITVIGARGSGKTALADLIATGGYAISEQLSDTSFIKRAYDHLQDTSVSLHWLDGRKTSQAVRNTESEEIFDYPRVQYLSQKFVDQLCSSEGMTDRLIIEIEKVIFNAHPKAERFGLAEFQQLLAQKASEARFKRVDQETVIQQVSEQITVERTKKNNLPSLQKRLAELDIEIKNDKFARDKLLLNDKDHRLGRLSQITTALDAVSTKLEQLQNKLRSLNSLKQQVISARTTVFPSYTAKLKQGHSESGLSDEAWKAFDVDFKGQIDQILTAQITSVGEVALKLKGSKPSENLDRRTEDAYIPQHAKLEDQNYEMLSLEAERLKKLIGLDTENAKQYARLSEKILKSEASITKLTKDVVDAESAQERITKLFGERKMAYEKVFEALLSEEEELRLLYQPLRVNLQSQTAVYLNSHLRYDARLTYINGHRPEKIYSTSERPDHSKEKGRSLQL
jgi:hypothetical protein